MLLHTRSAKLVDPIPLPEWIRAPLGISRHTMVYVAQRNNDIGCELVVSPWRLNLWDDLWRIDFDFDDKVGLVAKLIKILDDNSVNVLSCETGVAGHCHTVEMICDCSGYDSEIDGASAWRRGRKEKPQLLGLTARIATEMINDLRFRRYEGPRLRIRRVNAYRRAHQDLDCAGPAKVLKGALVLPPAFLNSVRAHLRTGSEIWYSLTTDTKDRLLRVLLTGPGAVLLQLKLYVDKNARVLGQILEAIRALGLSILKSQLRH